MFYSDTHPVYVWDKRRFYLYPLFVLVKVVPKSNVIGRVCFAITYHSIHSAHMRLKGNSSQKSINFLLNAFCIN